MGGSLLGFVEVLWTRGFSLDSIRVVLLLLVLLVVLLGMEVLVLLLRYGVCCCYCCEWNSGVGASGANAVEGVSLRCYAGSGGISINFLLVY